MGRSPRLDQGRVAELGSPERVTRVLLVGYFDWSSMIRELLSHDEDAWAFEVAGSPESLAAVLATPPDVIVIDDPPEEFAATAEICGVARRHADRSAIVVHARRPDFGRIASALDAGADDCVLDAPRSGAELGARLRLAIWRRNASRVQGVGRSLGVGTLRLDLVTREATLAGHPLDLTTHQWLLLVCMLNEPGRPVAPAVLCSFAGIQADVEFRNLHTEIWRLRRKLPSSGGAVVRSIRKQGYGVFAASE